MSQPPFDAFNPASDVEAVARLASLAFAGPIDACKQWMQMAGHENFRVLRDGAGAAESCLLRLPMGQFFGGRVVPMLGIASVAVAPESRGKGLAKRMMQAAVRGAAEEGTPLLGLYASTQTLYRHVGFEQCGSRFRIRIPTCWIDVRERAGQIVALSDTTDRGVRACYRAFARENDGMLDRGEYIWTRIKNGRGGIAQGFGVRSDSGELEGYLFLTQQRLETGRHDVSLADFAFSTPRAARRLLGLIADFGAMADHVEFFGGPTHPILFMLAQQRYAMTFRDYWLLRLADVKAAMESRGFNPALRGELHLRIDDPLVERNSGAWVLSVAEGRGQLAPGGRGDLRIGPRGLAALYTGFAACQTLRAAELCDGAAEALSQADALFAARAPWMPDQF